MPSIIPRTRRRLIARIAALARTPAAPAPRGVLAALAGPYLHGVAEDDIAARPPGDWLAMMKAHVVLARGRRRGRALVRVFNPDARRDGFTSPHTLVLIATDDMPFLVDSATMAFTASGHAPHLVVHPVLAVSRDARGRLRSVQAAEDASDSRARSESWQLYEVDRLADATACGQLARRLQRVLADVRVATQDWRAMTDRARAAARHVESAATRAAPTERREAAALLDWMADGQFTFLAYREYRISRRGRREFLVPLPATGLGLLRPDRAPSPRPLELTGEIRRYAHGTAPILIAKGDSVSTVHRATWLDYVGVKRVDARGRTIGEHRFLGLWTSSAYHLDPRDIPVLRRRVTQVLQRFSLEPSSHDGKAVLHVLETHPRDELFQASAEQMVETVRGIVNLYGRARTRLFLRWDPFGRFCSCLLYLPRDGYDTEVRLRVERLVLEATGGLQVESQVQITESESARLYLVVRLDPQRRTRIEAATLERRVALVTRSWRDELRIALLARHDEAAALALAARYAGSFGPGYRADVPAAETVDDIAALAALDPADDLPGFRLLRRASEPRNQFVLRLYRHGGALAVADLLPTLANLGFRLLAEHPHRLTGHDQGWWVQDIVLEVGAGRELDIARDGERILAGLRAVWIGLADNDGFNRLIVAAGLGWREALALRAYGRWLLQLQLPFSQAYLEETLATHAPITRLLAQRFTTQADPTLEPRERKRQVARIDRAFERMLDRVARQDEDRILRAFHAAIGATVRTNFHQRGDAQDLRPCLALKIETRRVAEAPRPRPLAEVFVHSPRVEGVHLRMGRVARGGLRWSDRREDFRTEVLALMKAQHVKNTLIVPVGAKGGFVPRRAPTDREAAARDGVECYRLFVGALLDVTDNIVGGDIAAPPDLCRHDDDDPYLVVAADKGTASFSDIANGIALGRGFWLGDAFASGGSAGYDHKGMGITARGAWECVARHFRDLGIDIAERDFTVAGIGDMSGDVFGNGLMLSPRARLVAAFDHRHIIIDPSPDAAKSLRERTRLFRLPRSSWDDYDRRLLSKGGGVFSRQAKSIALSPEARRLLGLESSTATPQEIIRRILCLDVDLLWNGGIGTYVKSADETNATVGDRNNDAVRVDGAMLRCRVVGEGGNLGFTQRGRVEFALRGGRINTDFIDNSAGVNCSDVEVNIKIALHPALESRRLSRPARDRLLVLMTGDVAALVLRNNYLQSQAISMLEVSAAQRLAEQRHLITVLERAGTLDRRLESLPDDEDLAERSRTDRGLTRPELATLLSFAKIWLNERLIQSDVPEDPYLAHELERYFPSRMRRRFAGDIAGHRLRREIIATATTNSLVNRMGPVFPVRVAEETGASVGAVARAYTIAREITGMRALWAEIEALDGRLPAALQYEMLHETSRVLRRLTYWLIRHRGERPDIERAVAGLGPGVRSVLATAPGRVHGDEGRRIVAVVSDLERKGVPARLANRIGALALAESGIDVVDLAADSGHDVARVGEIHAELGAAVGLGWIRQSIELLPAEDHWQSLARNALREQAYAMQRQLCARILRPAGRDTLATRMERWRRHHRRALDRIEHSQADMRATATDYATLAVALAAVRQLAER